LGAYDCKLAEGSLSRKLYGQEKISERHRHRYEVNNRYRHVFQKKGMLFAGENTKQKLVEIIELAQNKFFVASQFHPELKSRPLNPHPLFVGLVAAAINKKF